MNIPDIRLEEILDPNWLSPILAAIAIALSAVTFYSRNRPYVFVKEIDLRAAIGEAIKFTVVNVGDVPAKDVHVTLRYRNAFDAEADSHTPVEQEIGDLPPDLESIQTSMDWWTVTDDEDWVTSHVSDSVFNLTDGYLEVEITYKRPFPRFWKRQKTIQALRPFGAATRQVPDIPTRFL